MLACRQQRNNFGDRPPRFQTRDPDTRLYVGNLPYSVNSEDVKEHFAPVGEVDYADVKIGRDGRPRGFAIVQMGSDEEAERAAAEMHDTDVGGRRITVRRFRPE